MRVYISNDLSHWQVSKLMGRTTRRFESLESAIELLSEEGHKLHVINVAGKPFKIWFRREDNESN